MKRNLEKSRLRGSTAEPEHRGWGLWPRPMTQEQPTWRWYFRYSSQNEISIFFVFCIYNLARIASHRIYTPTETENRSKNILTRYVSVSIYCVSISVYPSKIDCKYQTTATKKNIYKTHSRYSIWGIHLLTHFLIPHLTRSLNQDPLVARRDGNFRNIPRTRIQKFEIREKPKHHAHYTLVYCVKSLFL